MIRTYEIKDVELALERVGVGAFGYRCQPGHLISFTGKTSNHYTHLGMIVYVSWTHMMILWSSYEPSILEGFKVEIIKPRRPHADAKISTFR